MFAVDPKKCFWALIWINVIALVLCFVGHCTCKFKTILSPLKK